MIRLVVCPGSGMWSRRARAPMPPLPARIAVSVAQAAAVPRTSTDCGDVTNQRGRTQVGPVEMSWSGARDEAPRPPIRLLAAA